MNREPWHRLRRAMHATFQAIDLAKARKVARPSILATLKVAHDALRDLEKELLASMVEPWIADYQGVGPDESGEIASRETSKPVPMRWEVLPPEFPPPSRPAIRTVANPPLAPEREFVFARPGPEMLRAPVLPLVRFPRFKATEPMFPTLKWIERCWSSSPDREKPRPFTVREERCLGSKFVTYLSPSLGRRSVAVASCTTKEAAEAAERLLRL